MSEWRAQHTGPGGMRGAATFDDWVAAANWLAAMLRVIQPVHGFPEACRALALASHNAPFTIEASRHQFEIIDAAAPRTEPPQADLFAAAD